MIIKESEEMLGKMVKYGDRYYYIEAISPEPWIIFDDGSKHYAMTLRACGSDYRENDVLFVNDAQIKSYEDISKDSERSPFYCNGICESCKYGMRYNNGKMFTCDQDKLKADKIYPISPSPPLNN